MGSIDHISASGGQAYTVEDTILGHSRPLRVICIGAGATGIDLAYKMKRHLTSFELQIYEKNPELGGTWFENTYPGCACDIPAHIYEYEWAPNPDWSQFYASQPEILQYFRDTARKFDLEKFIRFGSEVVEARWNEDKGQWLIRILDRSTGAIAEDWCHFFINGGGFLNNWQWPQIEGLHSFQGSLLHSAAWQNDVELKGKRVAVIGNGSSGIQLVTAIQPAAAHLTTFIRSPTWIATTLGQDFAGPNGANFDYTDAQKREFEAHPEKLVAYRKAIEADLNSGFASALHDSPEQALARENLTQMMRARLGKDNGLADRIIPSFGVGCRRPTPGVGYLEVLTEKNVRVVFDSITKVVPQGIEISTGEVIELDAIVCATGFNVSWKPRFPIIGRNNIDMRDQWSSRPTAYLSFAVPNFPNYILYMGPNGPLSHGSALPSIEHFTRYVIKLLHKVQTEGYKSVVPKQKALDDFIEHADTFLTRTVWNAKCRSWLKGGKEDGPALVHPGSRLHWFHMLMNPRWEDWEWTTVNQNRFAYLGNGFTTMEAKGKDKAWYFGNPDQGYESII
ncbi:putative monooxygenase [Alternaria rosae]|uniref:putative monooxygenase n=1 Tax=Alternaria rosae TaxID=1187941 RepID=UPI001E8D264C|nr:putative monooxygenase [Alternaria rosae]KAH6868165.1 putative monooxygenase [Alternaria rosae]